MVAQIRTIIVEDEPLAQKKLAAFIERCPELNLVQIFSDGVTSLAYLTENPDSLVFLDIHIQTINGMQVLERLSKSPKIIITSAYEEYALKGFEYNVSDYLLKPYSFERFRRAVDKVVREINLESKVDKVEESFILVKSEYRLEKIELASILFIEGMKDYLRIHTDTRKIMTLRSFSSLAEELPANKFVRVHKSFMVALSHITAVEKDYIIIGTQRIPVGRSYKDNFRSRLR